MRFDSGVTLIETMIALVIMSVLAAIVYPAYAHYMVKARRVEAQSALLELMQRQERYFTQRNTFLAFSSASSDPPERRFRWFSGTSARTSAYELRGDACPGEPIEQCIVLSALPGTALVDSRFRDPDCEVLTVSSRGERRASGPAPRCWP